MHAAKTEKPRYTANGETLKLDAARCIGCGVCAEVCPHGVFVIAPSPESAPAEGGTAAAAAGSPKARKRAAIAHPGRCMECGACQLNCPTQALQVSTGVGCVAAIVRGKLTGSTPSCDCGGGACC